MRIFNICNMEKDSIIVRQQYVDAVLQRIDMGQIIVLTGQRRVGKSCVMRMVRDAVLKKNSKATIIFIDKEYTEFRSIKKDEDLENYVYPLLGDADDTYLFIDEVQDIQGFENTLRSMQAKQQCHIIVTGSNAKMLSSELSTYLSGRYTEVHIQSLSYVEFIKFHNLDDSDASLLKYLTYGGLPFICKIGIEKVELVKNYLENIYNTIVLKDVIEREQIRNTYFLDSLSHFISDNIGKNVSATSISKFMKSQNENIATYLVLNYLKFLCNAYIINKVPRFDIHGKRLLETNEKFYFEDLGLRNRLCDFNLQQNIEKVIENAIYLHLKNCGYKITVGYLLNSEIDFVAEKDGHRAYIQACYQLSNEDTRQREYGNLQAIKDNYPKYVVSMDLLASNGEYKGIKSIHLRDFLKQTEF